MFSNKLVFSMFLVFCFILFTACSSDNSVKDDDNNNNGKNNPNAIAANNSFESDGIVYPLKKIGIFYQFSLEENWLFIYGENPNNIITLKMSKELPQVSGVTKYQYKNDFALHKSNEFSLTSISAKEDSGQMYWIEESTALAGVKTEGFLYVRKNTNNTTTLYFNKIKLGDKNNNPTKTKEFSATFTFSNDVSASQSSNPTQYDLQDIE